MQRTSEGITFACALSNDLSCVYAPDEWPVMLSLYVTERSCKTSVKPCEFKVAHGTLGIQRTDTRDFRQHRHVFETRTNQFRAAVLQ